MTATTRCAQRSRHHQHGAVFKVCTYAQNALSAQHAVSIGLPVPPHQSKSCWHTARDIGFQRNLAAAPSQPHRYHRATDRKSAYAIVMPSATQQSIGKYLFQFSPTVSPCARGAALELWVMLMRPRLDRALFNWGYNDQYQS